MPEGHDPHPAGQLRRALVIFGVTLAVADIVIYGVTIALAAVIFAVAVAAASGSRRKL